MSVKNLKAQIREMDKLRGRYSRYSEEYGKITEVIEEKYEEIIKATVVSKCIPTDKIGVPISIHNIPSGRSMAKEKFNSLDDLTPVSTLNPDGKSKACQCGARYTAFPNHHMIFCDLWTAKQ